MNDELSGVELRRKVAEAVGWTWYDYMDEGDQSFAVQPDELRTVRLQHGPGELCSPISYNDAIAACEASGMLDFDWGPPNAVKRGLSLCKSRQDGTFHAEINNGCELGWVADNSDGPTAILRALLKALEAKNGND